MRPKESACSCIQRLLLVALLAMPGVPAWAQERIEHYDTAVDIRRDGSLEVSERIAVHAEGNAIRRGIYRDIPTRYRDRHGNRVVIGIEVLEVLRDGRAEPWFSERIGNGLRINTGNDDLLPVPARYTYTLRYRTTRQLGFFPDHDELYWNAIGTGWDFPIERATVQVTLPAAVPTSAMAAEAYTGPQGARGRDYVAQTPAPGLARWQLTSPLAPREGFTIVLAFPKDLVAAPTRAQALRWFLSDNRGVLVALLTLALLLAFCIRRWHVLGRDPPRGIVIARYDPPAGHSPAGLRYLRRMKYDTRCFSADVLQLAVDGHLRIDRDERLLKDRWALLRPASAAPGTAGAEPALLKALFPGQVRRLDLVDSNAATVAGAQAGHSRDLGRRYEPAMFNRNGASIGLAVLIAGAGTALALMVSAGSGIPALLAVVAAMIATLVWFGIVVKAPTAEGRRLLDEIEGLRTYLGVAERDELAAVPGPGQAPPLDAGRYERLLPYAVALEVEDAWTRKFTLAVGAAAAAATTRAINWYSGGPISDLGSLSHAVGSGLSAQIASASSPPGSSSGGGGGGSSGGGGGGGGGGGR